MARSFLDRGVYLLGQNYKRSVVVLPAATLAFSVLGAIAGRAWPDAVGAVFLQGGAVLRGEVWRLVTWPWFAFDGLSLILGAWALLLFGRDLAETWGSRRFLASATALSAIVGALTSLVGLGWREVGALPYSGPWPLVSAMAVSWGTLFAGRQILLFFAVPASGQALITITIATTFIFGALHGFPVVVPEAFAIAVTLIHFRVWPRIATRFRLRRLLSDRPDLRPVESGWNRPPSSRPGPNDSRWVH